MPALRFVDFFRAAVFHAAAESGFWITFPNFSQCLTQGKDMQGAYEMAVDALGLCISDMEKEKLPFPYTDSRICTSHLYCSHIKFPFFVIFPFLSILFFTNDF